jgi:hypothetical protein
MWWGRGHETTVATRERSTTQEDDAAGEAESWDWGWGWGRGIF